MFLFKCEDVEFGVKPMNCPGNFLLNLIKNNFNLK